MKTWKLKLFVGITLWLTIGTDAALAGRKKDRVRAQTYSSDARAEVSSSPLVCDTSLTPCPFLNHVLRKMYIAGDDGVTADADGKVQTVTIEALVKAAAELGVDPTLMNTLANARAEADKEHILVSKLLDPDLLPAHLASLARADRKLEAVDMDRLKELHDNPTFNTDGRISKDQLLKYQEYCWTLSKEAGFKDKFISSAEVELLWSLFGAYRDHENSIPLNLVYDFLKDNTLPVDFEPNKVDPVTRGRLIWRAIMRMSGCSRS